MKLCIICEDETEILNRISSIVRRVAGQIANIYNPGSNDRSMMDDLYQVAMLELITFLRSPLGTKHAHNDAYLRSVAIRAMVRGGKKGDGTKIGKMSQVGPLFNNQHELQKAEYNNESEWDVENIANPERNDEETNAVNDIISQWPEREQFIIKLVMAGHIGREIAQLEAQKYNRPKPVSIVAVSKWVNKLKDKLRTELNDIGITESRQFPS